MEGRRRAMTDGGMDMRQMWESIKKWLFPQWRCTLLLTAFSAAALALVFRCGRQDTPIACMVYVFSFYALTAGTAAVIRTGRKAWRQLGAIPLVALWRGDAHWRVKVGLVISLAVDLCYAIFRVISAALYASFWEGTLGVYYIFLCALRIFLIRHMPVTKADAHYPDGARAYRTTGWLLVGLDLALAGIAVQIVWDGRGHDYPGTMIYAAAAYSFYCLTMAVIDAVRYREARSPVLSAAKAVRLTTAMVSLFSLETAMLARFGEDGPFRSYMTAATAAAVCILVLMLAIYMVISARWRPAER